MTQRHVDIIVIGSGPGGDGAAMKATKERKRVCVVERYSQVGGGCTHWGTIPSKALWHAIQKLVETAQTPLVRSSMIREQPHFSQLVKTASSVIGSQVRMRSGFYERNHVELV